MKGGRRWQLLHGNERFQDLESADEIFIFHHLELLVRKLINFGSLFRVLLNDVFL
jgi:hypothetical protein